MSTNKNERQIVFKTRFAEMLSSYKKKLEVLPLNKRNPLVTAGTDLIFLRPTRNSTELIFKEKCEKTTRAYISSSGIINIEGEYILNETESEFLSLTYGCRNYFEFINTIKSKCGLPLICQIVTWHGK